MIQVFLSSTAKELSACRDQVYRAIEGLEGYHCVRMEDFGASNETPDELCRRRVAACDLFIILIGPLYGSVGRTGVSYTESEYNTAQKAGKPCLVFLASEDYLIPANVAEPVGKRRKQSAFRKKVVGRTRAMFRNSADLATKVLQAIRNWEKSPSEHSIIRIHRDGESNLVKEFQRPFLRFGRNPDLEFPLNDRGVSWEHGMVVKHSERFYYRHLSRTNNSWLVADAGEIVLRPGDQQEVPLSAHNQLRIGNTSLHVEIVLTTQRPQWKETEATR
jgi:hypothetical protein